MYIPICDIDSKEKCIIMVMVIVKMKNEDCLVIILVTLNLILN